MIACNLMNLEQEYEQKIIYHNYRQKCAEKLLQPIDFKQFNKPNDRYNSYKEFCSNVGLTSASYEVYDEINFPLK